MRVHITGRQVEITPALRKFAEEKLRKVDKLLGDATEAHVVLAIEKRRHTAEIQLKSRTALLEAARETGDLYASIGDVVDRLERQARKHKEKLTSNKKRDGRKLPKGSPAEGEPAVTAARPRTRGSAAPRLLGSERYRLKPLSAEDAVLELEATRGDILVYRDSRTYRVNVVYRRRDGRFGLVDPEF